MNKYLPFDQQDIDDIPDYWGINYGNEVTGKIKMTNRMGDTRALLDSISDYSDEYGDQELMATVDLWLLEKMGRGYRIVKDSEININIFNTQIKTLTRLSHKLSELSTKKSGEFLDYHLAITDAMLLIMKELQEV